jgi:hypothetical protein
MAGCRYRTVGNKTRLKSAVPCTGPYSAIPIRVKTAVNGRSVCSVHSTKPRPTTYCLVLPRLVPRDSRLTLISIPFSLLPTPRVSSKFPPLSTPTAVYASTSRHIFLTTPNSSRLDTPSVCLGWVSCCSTLPLSAPVAPCTTRTLPSLRSVAPLLPHDP